MASKGKEVYKTIKRSLSLSAQAASSGFGGTGGARYTGYTGTKQWIHPPDVINHGRVEYSVKLLGQTEVATAKGTQVVRDAIQKIRFDLQVKRGVTGNSGAKLQRVDIQINRDGLTVADSKTKMVLHKYPLHRISFCADDKQDRRLFSFIAMSDRSGPDRHDCFVFLSDKLAEEITLTIGEAFDLAYQKFISNNGRDLENKKQMILLRKRIAELEEENCRLKVDLAQSRRNSNATTAVLNKSENVAGWERFAQIKQEAPELPTSPVPAAPPPGIKPPPQSQKKSSLKLDNEGEDLAQALENIDFGQKTTNVFDDSFDPRAADAEKDAFGLDPFDTSFANQLMASIEETGDSSDGPQKQAKQHQTPEHFQKMITMVDERLAEMRDGFNRGLDVGDAVDFDATRTTTTTTTATPISTSNATSSAISTSTATSSAISTSTATSSAIAASNTTSSSTCSPFASATLVDPPTIHYDQLNGHQ